MLLNFEADNVSKPLKSSHHHSFSPFLFLFPLSHGGIYPLSLPTLYDIAPDKKLYMNIFWIQLTWYGCAVASYLLLAVNLCDTGSGCFSSVEEGGNTFGASFLSQSMSS